MYKQLVYNSTNGSGLWQGRSFEFIAFFNEFNSLNGNGFPKLCKNIAISNGAKLPNIYNGIGTGGPELALSYDFRVPNNIIFGSSNPNGTSSIQGGLAYSFSKQIQGSLPPTTILFMGAQNIGFIQQTFNIPFIENDGIDICPGASTDIFFKEFDNYVKSLQTTYAQETHEFGGTLSKFTMVPTSSALGISDDWFTNISNNLTISCSIPFDAYYAPINRNNDILTNSTIGSNWLYDQIMVTNNLIEITSATPFNFGENTSDIIFNDLTVKNQGSLYINGNYATDNISRNSSFSNPQTATKENSTFTVYTSCKKTVKITIDNGSYLNIGDYNRGGILHIQQGSELLLKNGSTTILDANSKIVIGNGGKLLFEAGALLNLLKSTSTIEILNGGKIQIGPDATFTFSGEGYMVFEDNYPVKTNIIAGGPNAKFYIDGSNKRKVIEVKGNEALYPSDYLASFEVVNSTIVLNENTRMIVGCPLKLYNVDILPNPSSPNLQHRGLHLFGQKTEISVLKVVRGVRGITSYNNYYHNDLNISAYTATNCIVGLWANDKAVNIFSGTFTDNSQQGIFLNALSRPSELNSITASRNISGVDVISNKGVLTKFTYPNFQFNGSGIYADNSTISAQCGKIKNSKNYNIYLKNNALLDLDPAHILNAGLIDFCNSSNVYTPFIIRLDKAAHGPYLNNSKSNFLSQDWRIWGDLRTISSLFSFLYWPISVNQNFWPPSPGGLNVPILNSMYKVTFKSLKWPRNIPTIVDLNYFDNTPLSASPNTSICNPFNNTQMSLFNGVRNKYKLNDGRNIKDLLKSGVDKLYSPQADVLGAIQDFKDVLNETYTIDELSEWTIPLMYTFDKLYESIARGLQNKTLNEINSDGTDPIFFTSTISLYNTWITHFSEDNKLKFTLKLNKALFNRLFNKIEFSLLQLNCLTQISDEDDLPLLQYYICVLDKEVKMANGQIERENYNVFEECISLLQIPNNRSIPLQESLKRNFNENFQINELKSLDIFNLFPNPAVDELNIVFNSSGKGVYKIEIFDILGGKVNEILKVAEPDNQITLDIHSLSAGSYILKLQVDNTIKIEQFIIAK